MIPCGYCGSTVNSYRQYSTHLKIFHSKLLSGEQLICGFNGCPISYLRFNHLKQHMIKKHAIQDENVEMSTIRQIVPVINVNNNEHVSAMACENETQGEMEPFIVNAFSDMITKFNHDGVFEDSAAFILHLRSKMNMSLASIDFVQNSCSDMMDKLLTGIKDEVSSIFEEHNISDDRTTNLLHLINSLRQPFIGVESVYKQNNYFRKKNIFIPPEPFTIGYRLENQRTGDLVCSNVRYTGSYVSQKKVFKKFLSLPGVFDTIKTYLETSAGDYIDDFKDGEIWQQHPVRLLHANEKNCLVIPVFDYYDDLEICNVLGSHAGTYKIGVKYTLVKGLPPMLNARLENIFLNTVIVANDRKIFSDKDCFSKYINEMSNLENEGFQLSIHGNIYKIFITMVQVVGDNLGLNSVLGFTESFAASYPCRVCKMRRENFSLCYFENPNLFRNKHGHQEDIAVGNLSQTGVNRDSVYNSLPTFHVVENFAFDIMHDMLEGVCRYVLQYVLKYIIFEKRFISATLLNERQDIFIFDHSSRPVHFSEDKIKNGSINIKAIEMLNIMLGLNLMIGDLIPENDDVWEMFLLLRQILMIVCGLTFTEGELVYLNILVAEFLQMYVEETKQNATLKFHNMTHYATSIKKVGPLYYVWIMRCEAKHADLKKCMQCSGNFKNVCQTIAQRHQMKQAALFSKRKCLCDEIEACNVTDLVLAMVENGAAINQMLGNYGMYRQMYECGKVTIDGINYEAENVLITGSDKKDQNPEFVKIVTILMSDKRDCYFICHHLHVCSHNHHLQAFEIIVTTALSVMHHNELQNLPSPWPLVLRKQSKSNKEFVSLRHKF